MLSFFEYIGTIRRGFIMRIASAFQSDVNGYKV